MPRSSPWARPAPPGSFLSLLRGLGEGWYWAGYHLVTYDAASDRDRDRYFGAQGATNRLLTAAVPPIAGAVIIAGSRWGGVYRGYQMVFGLAVILLLAAIGRAGRLDCGHRPALFSRRVWRLKRRNTAWHWVMWARLVEGLSGAMAGFVITILTYLVLQNEQRVGDFNGLIGLLGVACSLGLALWMRPRFRIPFALVGASLMVASTLLLPLYVSVPALAAFGLLRALGGPLHANGLAPLALQVIDRDPQAGVLCYEYIVSQELWLGIGRVASIALFLLLAAPAGQVILARIALVVAGAAPMVIWAAFARIPPPAPAEPRTQPAAA